MYVRQQHWACRHLEATNLSEQIEKSSLCRCRDASQQTDPLKETEQLSQTDVVLMK